MDKLKGIIPAVIVPLNDEGRLNERLLTKHLNFLIQNNISGLYIGGSTGEGPIMPADDREKVLECTLSCVAGRNITVIVHVGAVDTNTSLRLAKHAEKSGADCISAVPPFYYSVDSIALYNFYEKLALAVDIPLLIYNIPELTGVVVKSSDAIKLSEIDNIVGIKYSSMDIDEMHKMKQIRNGDFKVFFGVDQLLLAGLVMGADGGIGGTYNYMPSKYVDVYDAVLENDWEKAAYTQYKISKYYNICKKYGNSISCIKTILSIIHSESMGGVISPLRNLNENEKASLIDELKQNDFFEFIADKKHTDINEISQQIYAQA